MRRLKLTDLIYAYWTVFWRFLCFVSVLENSLEISRLSFHEPKKKPNSLGYSPF